MLNIEALKKLLADKTKNKFNIHNPHSIAIRAVLNESPPKSDPASSQNGRAITSNNGKTVHVKSEYRYSDFPSYIDEKIPGYNANFIGTHLIAGEGPIVSAHYRNDSYFFKMLLSQALGVTTVLAIGPAFDQKNKRQSYTEFFTEQDRLQFSPYNVSNITILDSDDFSLHAVTITLQRDKDQPGQTKVIEVFHLKNVADFGCIPLNTDTYLLLAYLYHLQEKKTLFTHCSAGLGRTGIVALLFKALDAVKDLKNPTEETYAQIIYQLWDELNQVRPGMVQNFEQMINAVQLMINIVPLLGNQSALYTALTSSLAQKIAERSNERNTLYDYDDLPLFFHTQPESKRPAAQAGLDSENSTSSKRFAAQAGVNSDKESESKKSETKLSK